MPPLCSPSVDSRCEGSHVDSDDESPSNLALTLPAAGLVRKRPLMDPGIPQAEKIVIAVRDYTSVVKDEALLGDEEVGSLSLDHNYAATLYDTNSPANSKRASSQGGSQNDSPYGNDPSHEQFLPTMSRKKVKLYDGMRIPRVVAELPRIRNLDIPDHSEDFSLAFLRSTLDVSQYATGWFVKRSSKKKTKAENKEFNVSSCMIIDGDHEPLLPRKPGQHGTQISAFLQAMEEELAVEENLTYIPLFIRRGDGGFRYYGSYREPRYSDRLGANEMLDLPIHVKNYWAKKVGARRKARWAIHAIQEAWPKTVIGWLDQDGRSIIPYSADLESALGEPLKSKISDLEAEQVSAAEILQSFENPDMGDKPAMRLFYEYLQCDGYDRAFYEALVAKKHGR